MSFDKVMEAHMVRWRSAHCPTAEHGRQNGRAYPWILPHGAWREGLWVELRPGGLYPLDAYLKREGIQKHAGVHNLKSSWVLCANLYWPFGQSEAGRALLAGFLEAHVDKRIAAVETVELEWAGEGALSPERLLGETGGARGSGQTSPDIAFFVRALNGRQGVVLTENKFVEHSFYRCSARRTRGSAERPANPDRSRCMRAAELLSDHKALCHQHSWGRRYWDHLADAGDRQAFAQLKTCPGASGGYQLLRQHALAEALAQASGYDPVISCVAFDERNEVLKGALRTTGLQDFRDWSVVFQGKASFAAFTHQAWFAWVEANDVDGAWLDWRNFVCERYDLR